QDPVHWTEFSGKDRGFWSITRHADILSLNAKTDLLSSARGIRMEDQTDEEYEARKTFQETDPPVHRAFRALASKAFSTGMIARYEDQIRAITTPLLEEAWEERVLDAVDRIARLRPLRMLAQIIGVPDEAAAFLVEKGDGLICKADPE